MTSIIYLGAKVGSGYTMSNHEIDIRNLEKGIYFLRFENSYTIKFIKE